MNPKPKLLVFDLDGTLVDTLPTLLCAMNRTLEDHSFPTTSYDHLARSLGNGMEILCRRCLPAEYFDAPSVYLPFTEAYKRHYALTYADVNYPYEGFYETLDELKSRGYILAVLSNKPHEYTVRIIEKIFGTEQFSTVFGFRPGHLTKPDPSSFLEICKIAGVSPDQSVMIGDSQPDIGVAAASGASCICVTWGYRTEDELIADGGKIIVRSTRELLSILTN